MARGKVNKHASKATSKRSRSSYSTGAKTGVFKEQAGFKETASLRGNAEVVKAVTTAIIRGTSPLVPKDSTPNKQSWVLSVSEAAKESKQPFSLSEIAEKLKERELFPEKIKRAKAFLNNL